MPIGSIEYFNAWHHACNYTPRQSLISRGGPVPQAVTGIWGQSEGAPFETLSSFHPGAAAASLLTGYAIIPFSLRGVQPVFKKLPWPNRLWGDVSVRFHRPLHPQPYLEKFTGLRVAAEQMTADIRASVASGIDYPDGLMHSASKPRKPLAVRVECSMPE